MALRESTTVEECCNKIVESIDNVAPTSEQSGSICDEAGALFGDSLNFVNTAQFLQREIHAGTYIVPQSDFIYSCDGFIKSITLAVSPNSVLKDAQGQERLRFHTFTDKAGDGSIYQRREDAVMWNSSIANTSSDRRIVNYRPIGSTQLCFNQGDVFGFTIEAGSDITILTRFPSDSNRLVQNVSSDLETLPGCPQLSDSGLYATMEGFSSTPLIHIKTGKISYCDIMIILVHYIITYFAEGFLGPPTEPPLTTTTELLTTQPYSAGSIGVLNSKITGAPVISIATGISLQKLMGHVIKPNMGYLNGTWF